MPSRDGNVHPVNVSDNADEEQEKKNSPADAGWLSGVRRRKCHERGKSAKPILGWFCMLASNFFFDESFCQAELVILGGHDAVELSVEDGI